MNSILNSVKKMLGIAPEYEHYDPELIMHINSVFSILTQLGCGPSTGFRIENKKDEWDDFTGDSEELELVKSYVFLKVKLIFDPPTTGMVMDSYKQLISELEWRINSIVDYEREEEV